MTEADWLAGTDPVAMLDFIGDRSTDRKRRLFACGCCRQLWREKPEDLAFRAITSGERWADEGVCHWEEERALWGAILTLQEEEMHDGHPQTALKLIYSLTCIGPDPFFLFASRRGASVWGRLSALPRRMLGWLIRPGPAEVHDVRERGTTWLPVIREIFGNPFRPVPPNPDWRTTTTIALAQQMYDSRDFSTMPILADALQDAGCTNADILDHCRGRGPHVRGCWVVDLVLGKE